MLHLMKLQSEPFYKILNGQKTIEMRLFDEKRQKIAINDDILFTFDEESVLTKVKDLRVFKSFKELYEHYEPSELGYTKISDVSYKKMEKYYSLEDIKKYGVIAIKIEVQK